MTLLIEIKLQRHIYSLEKDVNRMVDVIDKDEITKRTAENRYSIDLLLSSVVATYIHKITDAMKKPTNDRPMWELFVKVS